MAKEDIKRDEFKQLDPQDLDGVSGGNSDELAEDSIALSRMGFGSPKDVLDLVTRPQLRREVVKCWADAGVEVRYDGFVMNKYYINGEQVSREEALRFIQNK